MNSEDGAAHFMVIIPIIEETNGLVTMEKGEIFPLAKVLILNPSTTEGKDEVTIKIKDEFPNI